MIFFLYMCMCQIFARKQWKMNTYYEIDSMSVSLRKCECYDFITPFFSVREINLQAENSWVHYDVCR